MLSAYIFYSILYIIFNIPLNFVMYGGNFISVVSKIWQLIVLYGAGPLWFLPALAIAHICHNIINNKFGKTKSIVLGLIILIAAEALEFGAKKLCFSYKQLLVVYYPLVTVLRGASYTFFVQLGSILKNKYIEFDKSINNRIVLIICVCLVSIILMAVNVYVCKYIYGNDIVTLADIDNIELLPVMVILAITGSISVMGLSVILNQFKVTEKIFSWFGKHSLFIMATHLQFFLCAVARRITIRGEYNLAAAFMFVVIVEIILIKLFSNLFNKAIGYINNILNKFFAVKNK